MLVAVIIICAVLGLLTTAWGMLRKGTHGGYVGLLLAWLVYTIVYLIMAVLIGVLVPAVRWW